MPEYTLISTPPLAGYDKTLGATRLHAPADLAIVSIALPLGAEDAALKAVKSAYGAALPEPGRSILTKEGARLVRLGSDQAFVIFTMPNVPSPLASRERPTPPTRRMSGPGWKSPAPTAAPFWNASVRSICTAMPLPRAMPPAP